MSGVEVVPGPFSSLVEFSYAVLDPSAEAVVRDAAEIIHGVQKAYTSEVARQLLRAKNALPHGAFEPWVRDVLDIKLRTARYHLENARWLDDKPATLADLPPTVVHALADRRAPSEIVSGVVADAHAGAALDAGSIRAKLAAAKLEQWELKVAQKRSPKLTAAEMRVRRKRQAERDAAERAQAAAKGEAEQAERELRLLPLAQMVAGLGPDTVAALLALLPLYQERETFTALLREGAP